MTTIITHTITAAIIPTLISAPSSNQVSTNVGTLVAGVIGALAGILALLALYLLLRRKQRKIQDKLVFEGNLDPVRASSLRRHQNLFLNITLNDQEDEGMGGRPAARAAIVVSPFQYMSNCDVGQPEMQQYYPQEWWQGPFPPTASFNISRDSSLVRENHSRATTETSARVLTPASYP